MWCSRTLTPSLLFWGGRNSRVFPQIRQCSTYTIEKCEEALLKATCFCCGEGGSWQSDTHDPRATKVAHIRRVAAVAPSSYQNFQRIIQLGCSEREGREGELSHLSPPPLSFHPPIHAPSHLPKESPTLAALSPCLLYLLVSLRLAAAKREGNSDPVKHKTTEREKEEEGNHIIQIGFPPLPLPLTPHPFPKPPSLLPPP